jgi:predicted ATPase
MLVPPVNTPACGAVIADGQVGRRGVLRVGAGSFETCMVEPQMGQSGNEGLPGDVVIRTPDRRLRVFVSSTLGELAEERRAVSRAITGLRMTPVMFEVGARPHPPQELYRAYLAQSDMFVGLYWEQYGWVGPGMEISGLQDEFELSRALPRLLYVKGPAPNREPRLTEMLARIEAEGSVSYRHFRTPAELGRLVRDDLAMLLSERFAAARPVPAAAALPSPHGPLPLPVDGTSLVGREEAIEEVAGLVGEPGVRLVTLTGLGGIGKTRLAVAVGERLLQRFGARTAFVPLAAVTQPDLVLPGVARAVGAELAGADSPLEALVEYFGDDRWLLILDNLEQVVDAARDLDVLLARCRGVVVLATSRTVLGLRAEREYPVPPLPPPADPSAVPVEELAASPAVALFVDRARAVRPGFALTTSNAAAVAEICRRLEGLPLAIELAAARTRLLDPGALLGRLARSLDALGTGAVDMPERQRTLRATVEWSVGLLEDAERSLLEVAAVFVDGWTVEAAAQVAGLDEDQVLDLTEALARHSLVYLDPAGDGLRPRMLETIRAFVAERLAARPDVAEVQRRHADCYRALAEQVDRPLRGAGQLEWCGRLDAEEGNLAATVRWYLGHDTGMLPHLFRVLWLFWFLRDHLGEARSWVGQLLPTAGSFDLQARVELAWTAAATGVEVGDDQAALAARERLAPLLDGIEDPYLRAVSQLVMAWTSEIVGDFDSVLREALVSLEQLHGQDEPFWTALAAYTAGLVETTVGRYDDALPHLTEMRDLAERLDNPWLAAVSRVYLGMLAMAQGRPEEEARGLLDEGLELSLAAHSTRSVTLCLAAFARQASVEGDPEQAALLAGAAEGLRRRVGLQAWPLLRRGEAELVAQVRQALGTDRFDQVYAAGSRLSQQEAVAAVRGRRGTGAAAP